MNHDNVDNNQPIPLAGSIVRRSPSSNLTKNDISRIIAAIVDCCDKVDGVLVPARGTLSNVGKTFGVSTQTVSRIWNRTTQNRMDPSIGAYVASPIRKGPKAGSWLLYDRQQVAEEIAGLKPNQRRTLRAIGMALGISKTTIHQLYRYDNIIRRVTNGIKPALSDSNKFLRVMYACDRIEGMNDNGKLLFNPSYFEVHLDEKWFFLTKKDHKIYLTKEEVAPERTCRHKSHITKVMFLAAVARPQYDERGDCVFDGKIGMWPFTERKQAKKDSVNRPKGTWETKCVNVTYEVYLKFVINFVVPAIKAKFPRRHNPNITIGLQHDNAPSHFTHDDPVWRQSVDNNNNINTFLFKVNEQPPNSPDTNILDLGFFASIQSMQWGLEPPTNIDQLVATVLEAFASYDSKILDRVWLSHQASLNEIIAGYGSNQYTVPHLNKNSLKNDVGVLPPSLIVSDEAEQALEVMKLYDVGTEEDFY